MISRRGLITGAAALAAQPALAQGIPGLAIPPGLIAGSAAHGLYYDPAHMNSYAVLSNSNRAITTNTASQYAWARSTVSKASGQWAFEVVLAGSSFWVIAFQNASEPLPPTQPGDSGQFEYIPSSGAYKTGGTITSLGTPAQAGAGDVIRFEIDFDAKTVTVFANNAAIISAATFAFSGPYYVACSTNNTASTVTLNETPTNTPTSGYTYWI